MSEQYFEEEEFESQFNGQTVLRILKQATPHWPMLVGFLLPFLFLEFEPPVVRCRLFIDVVSEIRLG